MCEDAVEGKRIWPDMSQIGSAGINESGLVAKIAENLQPHSADFATAGRFRMKSHCNLC